MGRLIPSRMRSVLFVIIQFAMIFAIAIYAGIWGGVLTNMLTILAVFLGVWAVATMQYSVNVLPDVRRHQKLYTGGPYRTMRHPMYTSILLATLAWLQNRPDAIALALWLVLLVDLLLKLRYEERMLTLKFPEYKTYAARTKRLLPFVY